MRLVAFCDGRSDFRLVVALTDRVLRDHALWIADVLDVDPAGIRVWEGNGNGEEFFDIHHFRRDAVRLLARVPQGSFNGGSSAYGALMARTAFAIVRTLNAHREAEQIDAVVLVWDMDGQRNERRGALESARVEAQTFVRFEIVLGRADRMREAWVLAGFDPQTPEESARLDDERQQLGFWPNVEPHRLTAADETALRSAKRVLAVLTDGDHEREAECWMLSPLETLRARGGQSGLAEFLDELAHRLTPLCTSAR